MFGGDGSVVVSPVVSQGTWDLFLAWLDTHNAQLTVVSTIVSAIAAAVVGIWTVKLARVSKEQARLINRQLDLAREEFVATHRPRIIVRGFTMLNPDFGEGQAPRYTFLAQNIGDTPARIIEVRSGTYVHTNHRPLPNDLGNRDLVKFDRVLKSGEKEVFPGDGGAALEAGEHMQVFANNQILLCLGQVTYTDERGVQRITGFCRRYKPQSRTWEPFESDYEYTY